MYLCLYAYTYVCIANSNLNLFCRTPRLTSVVSNTNIFYLLETSNLFFTVSNTHRCRISTSPSAYVESQVVQDGSDVNFSCFSRKQGSNSNSAMGCETAKFENDIVNTRNPREGDSVE